VKRPSRRALLDSGAAAAGVGVVLAVWAPRLPAAVDFILTRSPGDVLVLPAARALQGQAGRGADAL
jgi:hypothetical protein